MCQCGCEIEDHLQVIDRDDAKTVTFHYGPCNEHMRDGLCDGLRLR